MFLSTTTFALARILAGGATRTEQTMHDLTAIARTPALVGGLAIAALGLAAPAALAQQSPRVTRSYRVNVGQGVLAAGQTVDARAVVTHSTLRRSSWWSR